MFNLRTIRLQFSLRCLLLAMALVSVALVGYRWPWTVEYELSHGRMTTQYRRGWYGKPVKDGPEVERTAQGHTWERWFSHDELRFERVTDGDTVIGEARYLGGKLHGPYWGQGSESRAEGYYHQGLQHGKWKYTAAEVIVSEEWRLGKRHGRRTWSTTNGRLLQSAEYDAGALVRWNDAPVAAELVRWLEAAVPDRDLRESFLTPLKGLYPLLGTNDGNYGDVIYVPARDRSIAVNWQTRFPKYEHEHARVGQPIGEAILTEALENSFTLACRFNRLNAVPITARSLDWQDRTGVYQVPFEPGSPQAQAWLEPTEASRSADPEQRFQDMFRSEQETGITLDTSAIHDFRYVGGLVRGGSLSGRAAEFPRRDLLGKHLDREGCYCEQRGNTLVIRRLE